MSAQEQDDYAAIAKPLPKGKGTAVPAAETDDYAAIAHPVEFTENERGEGTYEMAAPHGGAIKIPYSKIGDAAKSGYKMSNADRKRYLTDAAADKDLNKSGANPEGVKVVGKNSAGQDIIAPEGTSTGSFAGNFARSVGNSVVSAVKGVGAFINPNPSEEEKRLGQTSTFDILMRLPERAIQPNVDMAVQAGNEAKAGDYSAAAEHGIASVIPMVGPFAASAIDQTGAQIANRNYGGAAGTVAGNAIVAAAPAFGSEVIKGVTKLPGKAAGGFVDAVTKTGPREVQHLAEHTEAENAAATDAAKKVNEANAEKHLGSTIDAVQEANKHANKEGFRNDELEKKNEADRQEFNRKELERVKSEGEARLDALKKNKDKIVDYEERRAAIKKQNDANYRREVRQQNLQSKLKDATGNLDKLYQKTFKDATKSYNMTWNKWRDQVKGATADMKPTVNVVKAQEASMNPQQVSVFRDILRESGGDEEANEEENLTPEQQKDKLTMQYMKVPTYEELTPKNKSVIDDYVKEVGLDLGDENLKGVPATRLHGWKSQLERAVRTTQDGTVRYAIGKVLQQLRQTEQDVSASVGPDAVKQLTKARSITGPYFDAFFKSPDDLPRAAGQSLREQNPEYVKEKGAQQRLERIAKYNPELGAAANLVANLTQGLENIGKEKNIGKRSELPIHPDLNAVPSVTSAGEFQPKPFDAKPGPKNAEVPDRPPTEVPDLKSLSAEDLKKWKEENVKKTSQRIRDLALSRAMYASMTGIPISIGSFFMGHPYAAAMEISSPAAVIGFSSGVAHLLEKPGVIEYLSRVTDKDVAAYKKLPPEQQALFKDDLGSLSKKAEEKGATISPVLSAFIASPTVTPRKKKPTPKELLEQAHKNLQSGFYQSGYSGNQ